MARNFDGSNDVLTVDAAPVTAAPFTVALWAKSPSDPAVNTTLWWLGQTTDESDRFRLILSAAGGYNLDFEAGVASAYSLAASSVDVSAATWFHACGVAASATSRTVYLNGGNSGTNTTSRVPTSLARMALGSNGSDLLADYTGDIAELAIWNVALTAGEVAALSLGFDPELIRPDALVYYLPMEDANLADKIGGVTFTATGTTVSDHPPIVKKHGGWSVFVPVFTGFSVAAASTMPKLTSAAVVAQKQVAAGASTVAKLTSAAVAVMQPKAAAASTLALLTSAAVVAQKQIAAATSTLAKLTSAAVVVQKQVAAAASTLAKLTSAATATHPMVATAASTLAKLTSAAVAAQAYAAAGASTIARLTSAAVAVMHPKAAAASTLAKLTSAAVASVPMLAAGASTLAKLTSAAVTVMHPKAAAASTIAKLISLATAIMHPRAVAASTIAKLTSAALAWGPGPGHPAKGTAHLVGPPARGSAWQPSLDRGSAMVTRPPGKGSARIVVPMIGNADVSPTGGGTSGFGEGFFGEGVFGDDASYRGGGLPSGTARLN